MTMSLGPADTRYGAVSGFVEDGVQIFKGIPYGKSTGGAGRFMPPQPPDPWTGIRETVALGPAAPAAFGTAADTMSNPDIIAMIEGAAEYVPSSEDCLVLNVWTPGADATAKRPVMVWCHGGGFFAGSGGGKWNDGTNLSRHGRQLQPSAEYSGLPLSGRIGRWPLSGFRQCWNAGCRRRVGMGARQYRSVRR
jgi:para-nitrobenzyl esterase